MDSRKQNGTGPNILITIGLEFRKLVILYWIDFFIIDSSSWLNSWISYFCRYMWAVAPISSWFITRYWDLQSICIIGVFINSISMYFNPPSFVIMNYQMSSRQQTLIVWVILEYKPHTVGHQWLAFNRKLLMLSGTLDKGNQRWDTSTMVDFCSILSYNK